MRPTVFVLAATVMGWNMGWNGCANAGWFDGPAKVAPQPAQPPAPTDLQQALHQAQNLRLTGEYPQAIKILSQLMLVASDDPRVIGEYGKTLVSMGRAKEAVNFLTRAQELEPADWTLSSALGVGYDEEGDQRQAQIFYRRALALKPDEASVLNNYALSRLLAKDLEGARQLAARAEIANATVKDAMITRTIAMVDSMTNKTSVQTAATSAQGFGPKQPTGSAPPRSPQAPNVVVQKPALAQIPVLPNPQQAPGSRPMAEAAPAARTAAAPVREHKQSRSSQKIRLAQKIAAPGPIRTAGPKAQPEDGVPALRLSASLAGPAPDQAP